MSKEKLSNLVSVLALVLAIAHILAMKFNLYFTVWWFDIPIHLLGGLWAGMFAVYYYTVTNQHIVGHVPPKKLFIIVISGVLIVGFSWEAFEYFSGYTFTTKSNYITDTIIDIVFDIIGGITAWLLVKENGYLNLK